MSVQCAIPEALADIVRLAAYEVRSTNESSQITRQIRSDHRDHLGDAGFSTGQFMGASIGRRGGGRRCSEGDRASSAAAGAAVVSAARLMLRAERAAQALVANLRLGQAGVGVGAAGGEVGGEVVVVGAGGGAGGVLQVHQAVKRMADAMADPPREVAVALMKLAEDPQEALTGEESRGWAGGEGILCVGRKRGQVCVSGVLIG